MADGDPCAGDQTMLPTIRLLPTAAIDADALSRDRTAHDAEALTELRLSISSHGLRMPVEVFELAEPEGDLRYGLISGYRRLAAFRTLHQFSGNDRYLEIPALIREPQSITDCLVAMVEENEIRAEISPYERGRLAVTTRNAGLFPTVEQAVETLYPTATRQKRNRLRAIATLCEELDGHLAAPETLSERQTLRIAAALAKGFGDLIRHALAESPHPDAAAQWQILLPILVEAECPETPEPSPRSTRPGRPRRTLSPRHGLDIRREMTRHGWCLHFTGREARGELIDLVFDQIERMFSPV
jgi:ParB family transcriptional regulator, chromosome partitioning protein